MAFEDVRVEQGPKQPREVEDRALENVTASGSFGEADQIERGIVGEPSRQDIADRRIEDNDEEDEDRENRIQGRFGVE